jgi:hypothetical protein
MQQRQQANGGGLTIGRYRIDAQILAGVTCLNRKYQIFSE